LREICSTNARRAASNTTRSGRGPTQPQPDRAWLLRPREAPGPFSVRCRRHAIRALHQPLSRPTRHAFKADLKVRLYEERADVKVRLYEERRTSTSSSARTTRVGCVAAIVIANA